MPTPPENEEPGFEHSVNELPGDQDDRAENTLEDDASPEDEKAAEMEEAQKEAAEERKEGGYQ